MIAEEASLKTFVAKNEHPSSPKAITIDIQTQTDNISSKDSGLNTGDRRSSVDNVT